MKRSRKGTQDVLALDPKQKFTEEETVTVYAETDPGEYLLVVCADGLKAMPEGSEKNNCLASSRTVEVIPLRDLVVTSVAVAPLSAVRGQSLVGTVAVANNQGLADVGASRRSSCS